MIIVILEANSRGGEAIHEGSENHYTSATPHTIMEIDGVTDSCGVRGVYMGEAPLYLKGFLEKRIAWQELVADAAVKGDRNLALQALLLDEMAIVPEKAEAMLDELLAASKDLLPQFEEI